MTTRLPQIPSVLARSAILPSKSLRRIPTQRTFTTHPTPRPSLTHSRPQPYKSHARRDASSYSRYSPRTLLRTNPIAFPLSILAILLSASGFAYGVSIYLRMYRQMGSYPEAVGLKLRRAIYFTDVSPDSAQAMKAFVQALQLASEHGMHPLCDEVFGIKVELVRFLEKTGNVRNAIEVLEALKADCLRWLEVHGSDASERGERTRLLGWACKVATRVADLYGNPYIADGAKMEENLVWAVETTIRERQRREKEGVRDCEGEWLSLDDQGSQLEALAHFYEERGNRFFAGQLFLQALMLKPVKDCHAVVLMNNLAISMAQQIPPREPGSPPPSRTELAEAGKVWARQALALARRIEPPVRNQECDMGCAVATHNLGEFAEMVGDVAEARKRYEEAASLAGAIGFEEGIANANEGIRRLGGGGGGKKTWWDAISNR